MTRFPGRSATWRVLSISFLAFLLRISTLTLALLSILMYGFLDFFRALTFDLIDCTRFSSWIAIWVQSQEQKLQLGVLKKKWKWEFGFSSSINLVSLTSAAFAWLSFFFAFNVVYGCIVFNFGVASCLYWHVGQIWGVVLKIITGLLFSVSS